MNNTPNPKTPKTISEKEQETLLFWNENKIFEKSLVTPGGEEAKGNFSFYDGPPFATGLPHAGTLMAGTVKDVIPRYQTMKGNSVRRKWGWDCHGLPIENLIEKKLGLASKKDIEDFGIDKFNRDAHESVLQYEAEWKEIIPRSGRFVDMEDDYKTMDSTYTESIWWAWKTLYEKGLAFEGNKMMHICPRCETPLAQSEVGLEYTDVTDLSVTAKFELVDEPRTFVLAWTTTPWTLPGNSAIALHKNIEYIKFNIKNIKVTGQEIPSFLREIKDNEYYITSIYFFENEISHVSIKEGGAKRKSEGGFVSHGNTSQNVTFNLSYEIFEGASFIGKKYKPVFPYFENIEMENKENIWKIWHADFITEDVGTGIAHEAPAFGAEDMELAKVHSIPVIKHVKMDGTFIAAVTDFAGMKVKVVGDTQSADIEIIKYLAHNGGLFEKHKIIHSYPLCWRCKTPLLNYATSSWFVDVPKMKAKLLSENQKVVWIPEHIRDGRFGKWLEGAYEWAVSRTRYWGAPLPVWKSEIGEVKIIGSLQELAELNANKPKNTYYAVRHGEAESNITRTIDSEGSGDPNNHLTEKGKEQARHAGHFAKDKKVDIIITSPFLRAKETAHFIQEACDAELVIADRLREFNTGIYAHTTIDEFHKIEREEYGNINTVIPGGESHKDVMHRTMAVLHECEEKYEGKTILFTLHGGLLWLLEAAANLKTDEEITSYMLAKEDVTAPNGHIVPVQPLLVPRDETGAINLHRPYIDKIKLEINGVIYTRIPDVFDCWFESGSMPFASLHYPFENKEIFDKNYPADFIAESMDQTRGWFYSLMNLGVGLFDKAPYKHVIVNGLINAADGKKISKSLHNYTDPSLLIEKFGADAFRYYMMSSPVVKGESINFKDEDLEGVYKKLIVRLENVVSLYVMNTETGITPNNTSPAVLDVWIMSRLHEVVREATKGLDTYKIDEAFRPFDLFIDDLSVWYTRRSRERLKGDTGESDKLQALETLTYVLQTFAKVIAPVMPFIAERIYKEMNGPRESVHLESWPKVGTIDEEVLASMIETRKLVSEVLMKRTESKIAVRQPLAKLTISTELANEYLEIIAAEVNVKEVIRGESTSLDTTITDELLAEGDVRNLMRAIQDARKEKGLSPKDKIILTISYDVPELFKADIMKTCNVESIVLDTSLTEHEISLSSGLAHFVVSKI